mgnify:CR=1 FL=1
MVALVVALVVAQVVTKELTKQHTKEVEKQEAKQKQKEDEILLLENQEKIIGLAIEFHNCDLLSSKVYDFVERFKLN